MRKRDRSMSPHVYFSLSPHSHVPSPSHKRGEGENERKIFRVMRWVQEKERVTAGQRTGKYEESSNSMSSHVYFSLSPHGLVPFFPNKREGEGENVRKILRVMRCVQKKERAKAGERTGKKEESSKA